MGGSRGVPLDGFCFLCIHDGEDATHVSSWNGDSSGLEGVTLASVLNPQWPEPDILQMNSKNIKE